MIAKTELEFEQHSITYNWEGWYEAERTEDKGDHYYPGFPTTEVSIYETSSLMAYNEDTDTWNNVYMNDDIKSVILDLIREQL